MDNYDKMNFMTPLKLQEVIGNLSTRIDNAEFSEEQIKTWLENGSESGFRNAHKLPQISKSLLRNRCERRYAMNRMHRLERDLTTPGDTTWPT